MAITDPFVIAHQGKQRKVDVQGMSFKTPTGGDISLFVDADIWLDGGSGVDAAPVKMKKAEKGANFSKSEVVAGFMAKAGDLGLTITPAEIGQLITGGVEQAIRARYED